MFNENGYNEKLQLLLNAIVLAMPEEKRDIADRAIKNILQHNHIDFEREFLKDIIAAHADLLAKNENFQNARINLKNAIISIHKGAFTDSNTNIYTQKLTSPLREPKSCANESELKTEVEFLLTLISRANNQATFRANLHKLNNLIDHNKHLLKINDTDSDEVFSNKWKIYQLSQFLKENKITFENRGNYNNCDSMLTSDLSKLKIQIYQKIDELSKVNDYKVYLEKYKDLHNLLKVHIHSWDTKKEEFSLSRTSKVIVDDMNKGDIINLYKFMAERLNDPKTNQRELCSAMAKYIKLSSTEKKELQNRINPSESQQRPQPIFFSNISNSIASAHQAVTTRVNEAFNSARETIKRPKKP